MEALSVDWFDPPDPPIHCKLRTGLTYSKYLLAANGPFLLGYRLHAICSVCRANYMLAAESTCYGAVSAEPATCYGAVSAEPTTCYGAVSAEPITCCLHLQSRLHIFTAAYLQYMSAERHRQRERENWVTFNYACVYVCIWALFSLSSLRSVWRKPEMLNTMWCYCYFYLRWITRREVHYYCYKGGKQTVKHNYRLRKKREKNKQTKKPTLQQLIGAPSWHSQLSSRHSSRPTFPLQLMEQ